MEQEPILEGLGIPVLKPDIPITPRQFKRDIFPAPTQKTGEDLPLTPESLDSQFEMFVLSMENPYESEPLSPRSIPYKSRQSCMLYNSA